jgi:DNA-binding transcriptional ArsR family regulator
VLRTASASAPRDRLEDSAPLDLRPRTQYFTDRLFERLEHPMVTTDTLSRTLAALADPTRRAILTRLRRGTATVTELAQPFDLRLPAISKHLKVLERARLIERGRQAQWRPCTLRPEPLKEAAEWLERYRELWEGNFQALDALLGELKTRATRTSKRRRGKR